MDFLSNKLDSLKFWSLVRFEVVLEKNAQKLRELIIVHIGVFKVFLADVFQ
jgi:hypothetical protein